MKIGTIIIIIGTLSSIILPVFLFNNETSPDFTNRQIWILLVVSFFISITGAIVVFKSVKNKNRSVREDGKLLVIGGIVLILLPMFFNILDQWLERFFLYEISYWISKYFLNDVVGFSLIGLGLHTLLRRKNRFKTETDNPDNVNSSLNGNKQRTKKSIFTYIGILLVSFLLVRIAVLLFMELYYMEEGTIILPADCMRSDFFWFLLLVGTVIAIFTVGFTGYKPMIERSDGTVSESMDMTDQMGAGFLTILSPFFMGAGIALIPYYLLYWLLNTAVENIYVLIAIIAIPLALLLLTFLSTRPKFSRTKEVFWIVLWGSTAGSALYFLFNEFG